MPVLTFFVYIAVNWWASWYPGAEPGGGGYVAQRIMSAKDERHALLAAVWFNIAHYALRPWPWIVVALVSMVLYPASRIPSRATCASWWITCRRSGAAFSWPPSSPPTCRRSRPSSTGARPIWSTTSTAASGRRGRAEAHYASVGRVATLVMMVISGVVTYYIGSVEGAWKFLLALGAGTGLVYLLRWYWWRINAWSEVSAMTAALVVSLVAQFGVGLGADDPRQFAWLLLVTTTVTTVVWLAVTFATPAEPADRLRAFYARVRPGGPGWRAVVPGAAAEGALGVRAGAVGDRLRRRLSGALRHRRPGARPARARHDRRRGGRRADCLPVAGVVGPGAGLRPRATPRGIVERT